MLFFFHTPILIPLNSVNSNSLIHAMLIAVLKLLLLGLDLELPKGWCKYLVVT